MLLTARRKPSLQLALALLLIFVPVSCSSGKAIWETSAKSPDGRWLATAKSMQYGGFGTDSTETTVSIEEVKGLRSSTRVLAFMDDGESLNLTLHWPEANALEVSYVGSPEVLYYQVVKTSGVNISVRNTRAYARPK